MCYMRKLIFNCFQAVVFTVVSHFFENFTSKKLLLSQRLYLGHLVTSISLIKQHSTWVVDGMIVMKGTGPFDSVGQFKGNCKLCHWATANYFTLLEFVQQLKLWLHKLSYSSGCQMRYIFHVTWKM